MNRRILRRGLKYIPAKLRKHSLKVFPGRNRPFRHRHPFRV
jgi:hypothetical protein